LTTSDPEHPAPSAGATEYPSLEDTASQADPHPPVDYPADAGLPPPVYPSPYAAGYPGYPGSYPGPYYPYWRSKPPGTNGKAIAALATSLAGLLCCGLPSIVGLVLGVVGMRETKRTGQDGYAIALVGAMIGGLAVAGWVLYLLLSISIYASGWQWAP
jgi:Domain of unknown function (DUF4190)